MQKKKKKKYPSGTEWQVKNNKITNAEGNRRKKKKKAHTKQTNKNKNQPDQTEPKPATEQFKSQNPFLDLQLN